MKFLVVTTGSMSVAYLPDENHVATPLNYDGRIFALHSRSDLEDCGGQTPFRDRQHGFRLWATYEGDGFVEERTRVRAESPEHAEQCATIYDLARQLGYSAAKIKMLLGRRARNPVCLERKLRNQLDERPENAFSQERR